MHKRLTEDQRILDAGNELENRKKNKNVLKEKMCCSSIYLNFVCMNGWQKTK